MNNNGCSSNGYSGMGGCQVYQNGVRCGETKTLTIIQEFKQLYEDKMRIIDQEGSGDCHMQAKICLQQDWIRDLTEQNEMLVRAVEELEQEATERVLSLEEKLKQSSKCACETLKVLEEKEKKIQELQNELDNVSRQSSNLQDTVKDSQIATLKQSMLDMRDALTAEVADKHDTIVMLRRDVQLLEDQCRKADQQTHFKDDIIKELRKELKQLKAAERSVSRDYLNCTPRFPSENGKEMCYCSTEKLIENLYGKCEELRRNLELDCYPEKCGYSESPAFQKNCAHVECPYCKREVDRSPANPAVWNSAKCFDKPSTSKRCLNNTPSECKNQDIYILCPHCKLKVFSYSRMPKTGVRDNCCGRIGRDNNTIESSCSWQEKAGLNFDDTPDHTVKKGFQNASTMTDILTLRVQHASTITEKSVRIDEIVEVEDEDTEEISNRNIQKDTEEILNRNIQKDTEEILNSNIQNDTEEILNRNVEYDDGEILDINAEDDADNFVISDVSRIFETRKRKLYDDNRGIGTPKRRVGLTSSPRSNVQDLDALQRGFQFQRREENMMEKDDDAENEDEVFEEIKPRSVVTKDINARVSMDKNRKESVDAPNANKSRIPVVVENNNAAAVKRRDDINETQNKIDVNDKNRKKTADLPPSTNKSKIPLPVDKINSLVQGVNSIEFVFGSNFFCPGFCTYRPFREKMPRPPHDIGIDKFYNTPFFNGQLIDENYINVPSADRFLNINLGTGNQNRRPLYCDTTDEETDYDAKKSKKKVNIPKRIISDSENEMDLSDFIHQAKHERNVISRPKPNKTPAPKKNPTTLKAAATPSVKSARTTKDTTTRWANGRKARLASAAPTPSHKLKPPPTIMENDQSYFSLSHSDIEDVLYTFTNSGFNFKEKQKELDPKLAQIPEESSNTSQTKKTDVTFNITDLIEENYADEQQIVLLNEAIVFYTRVLTQVLKDLSSLERKITVILIKSLKFPCDQSELVEVCLDISNGIKKLRRDTSYKLINKKK